MEKKSKINKQNKNNALSVNLNKLDLLITIIDRKKADFYIDFLQSFEVNMQFTFMGEGTADKKMLSILGLYSSDKAVICSVIRNDRAKDALNGLQEKFNTIASGKGIAVTVPLSSMIGVTAFGFLSNNKSAVKEIKNESL